MQKLFLKIHIKNYYFSKKKKMRPNVKGW
jgi:hypothetical protein